ncbi:MAG: hypothetical protein WDN03_17455 [Rhizomicrobium sp.]
MRARNFTAALLVGALLTVTAAGAQTAPLPGTLPAEPSVVLRPPVGTPPAAPPPSSTMPMAAPGAAQQRFRGTLQEFDGPFLTLKTADRKVVTLGMTTATRIIHNRLLQLAELQPGWYIGVAALKSADGKTLRAQGIRVYPANARGAGEGAYPPDPTKPERLVINGTVAAVAPGGIGGTLTLSFHGALPVAGAECGGRAVAGGCTGTAQIQFARGVPIVAIQAGDVSLLLPGATITAAAAPDAGGTLVAVAVTVERDAPPPKSP